MLKIIDSVKAKVLWPILIGAVMVCYLYQRHYPIFPEDNYSAQRILSSLSTDNPASKSRKPAAEPSNLPDCLSESTLVTDGQRLNSNKINNNKTINPDFSNVIFIGDSITYGFIKAHNTPVKDDHVYAKIGAHVFEGLKLLGYDAGVINKRCNTSVDFVFIMFGANDYGYDMRSYKAWYKELIEQIKKMFPQAEIILQSVMPMGNTVREPYRDQEPERLNKIVRVIAGEEEVRYLDLSGSIPSAAEYLLADGLHFKPELYPYWIRVIEDKEKELLNQH